MHTLCLVSSKHNRGRDAHHPACLSIVTLTSFHRLIVRPRWIRGASGGAKLSVAMMIGGSVMAAYFDLNFELKGYLLILMNDFFTAAYGISIKRALNLNIPQTRCVFYVTQEDRACR